MTEYITREQAEELIDKTVRRTLNEVGLNDEEARRDIRELRDLIGAWRDTKKTILRTTVRWGTIAILAGLAAWFFGWRK